MSFHSQEQFSSIATALEERLQVTLTALANEFDLGPLDLIGLNQMSISINEVCRELLMFGANAWPNSAATLQSLVA